MKNYRRIGALFLAFAMLISCIVIELPVYAESAVESEAYEAPQVELTTAEYPVMLNGEINTARLAAIGNFSGLSAEEKAAVCEYYGLSSGIFAACEELGYSILDSVRIGKAADKYDLSVSAYVSLIEAYGDAETAYYQMDAYIRRKSGYSASRANEILTLMQQGHHFEDIRYAVPVAEALSCNISEIINTGMPDSITATSEATLLPLNDLQNTDHRFPLFCATYNVDPEKVAQVIRSKGASIVQVLNDVYQTDVNEDTLISDDNALQPMDAGTETGQPIPKQAHDHEMVSSPTVYFAGTNEMVSASTGGFSYRENLVHLKGINGMDIKLDMVFGSSTNIYQGGRYIDPSDVRDWYTNDTSGMDTGEIYTWLTPDSPIATGWSFDLPSVRVISELEDPTHIYGRKVNVWYYNMPNGGRYKIVTDASGNRVLEDYPKNDVIFEYTDPDTLTSANGAGVHYRARYINGNYEYYDDNGNIVEQGDKYGNKLMYSYYDEGYGDLMDGQLYDIVDTTGRRVYFYYGRDGTARYVRVVVVDNANENKNTEFSLYAIPASTPGGDIIQGAYFLESAGRGPNTKYFTYDTQYINIIDRPYEGTLANANGMNRVINMTKIEYATGLTSHYEYEEFITNNGQYGAKDTFRVKNHYETHPEDTGIYKYTSYSYTGDYSGYSARAAATTEEEKLLYADPDNLPESYTYKVSKTENGVTTETTFNNEQMPIQVRTINVSTGAVISTNTTAYDAYEMPYLQTSTTGQITTTQKSEYDQYGNMVKSWSAKANGTENSEYLTQYTYDTRYNMPTAKTYKRDADTTITEAYTLSADGKNVTSHQVSENGTLKARTDYAYDSYGNVSEERKYDGATTYISTYYDYSDIVGADRDVMIGDMLEPWNESVFITLDMTGAFLTRTWQNGGTDIDGAAIGNIETAYEYDLKGNLLKTTDALGKRTRMEYDDYNRMTELTTPSNKAQLFYYYVSPDEVSTLYFDEMDTGTHYFYDAATNLTRVMDRTSGENLMSYEYDAFYRPIRERNVQLADSGNVVNYTYDLLGRVTVKETTNTIGTTTVAKETYAYDDAATSPYMITTHTVVGDTYAPSVVNREYKNAYGEVEKTGQVTGASEYFTTYTYDYLGSPLTEFSALADQKNWTVPYTTAWEYDYAGRVLREYNAQGDYVSYEYDMLGRTTRFYDAMANEQGMPYYTSYQYDNLGNVILQTRPQTESANSVVKYKYDKLGRPILQKTLYDATMSGDVYHTVSYTYDWRGNVLTGTQGGVTTTNTYDLMGRLLTNTVGGKTTTYTYDRFSNVTSITTGGKTDSYTYDMNGFNTSHTHKSGAVTYYTPTALGQISTTSTANSGTRMIEYSLSGQIINISGGNSYVQRRYNDRGQMILEFEPGVEKVYNYDIAGKRESLTTKVLTTPQQSLAYSYNTLGQLTQVREDGTAVVDYYYDTNGRLINETCGELYHVMYSYNLDGSVNRIETIGNMIETEDYTYYLNGNVRTETSYGIETPTLTKTYTYNERNMLTGEARSDGKSTAYAYDARGNRTTKTVTENSANTITSYVYDDLNRLTSESTSDSVGLLARTYYVYDADGNMTLRSRESFNTAAETDTPAVTLVSGFADLPNIDTFEYNDFGELTSAKVNGVNSTYTYRADGLRWYKTVNGTVTRHLWDGDDVIMDMTDGYGIVNEYTRGLGLIRYTDGTSTQYYTRNRHGDTNHTIDAATATLANTYKYDAYGNQEVISDTDTNPFRYSGEYYDSETGFIYLRARYYDSTTGTFISEDPARDGINWYAYCAGNPVMYVDPSGEEYGWIIDFIRDYSNAFSGDVGIEIFYGNETNQTGFVEVTMGDYQRVFYFDGTIVDREYEAHGGLVYERSYKVADNVDGKLYMQRSTFIAAMGMTQNGTAKIQVSEEFHVGQGLAMVDFATNLIDSVSAGEDIKSVTDAVGFAPVGGKVVGNFAAIINMIKLIKNDELLSKGNYRAEAVTVYSTDHPGYYFQVVTIYGIGVDNENYQYVIKLAFQDGIPSLVL